MHITAVENGATWHSQGKTIEKFFIITKFFIFLLKNKDSKFVFGISWNEFAH